MLFIIELGAHAVTMLGIGEFLAGAGELGAGVLRIAGIVEGHLGRQLPGSLVLLQRKAPALVLRHGRVFTAEIFCHATHSWWSPRAAISSARGPGSVLLGDRSPAVQPPPARPRLPAGGSRT